MLEVRRRLVQGENARQIATATGVPVSTVGRWARGGTAAFGAPGVPSPWRPPDPTAYAYLLGLYLGDGCLARTSRTLALVITLDRAYPGIVEECVAAIVATAPVRVAVRPHRVAACVRVVSYWKRWGEAFPQHGAGRKHERRIVLAPWQRAVLALHPEPFLRGLVHSDGCRTTNRFTTSLPSGRVAEYAYARYFFSNLSPDIRALFCESCDRIGVRWTRSNHRNVSVSHRPSVARLDAFIGEKR